MILRILLIVPFFVAAIAGAKAQPRTPTAQEIAALRACAAKYADDVVEGEQQCLFNLVAAPCVNAPGGAGNLDTADCYRVEQAAWDGLLNEAYKALHDDLDAGQAAKLRDMQRAWIAYRDTTCGFYSEKARGSMAIPMASACAARETARRALLLKFFAGL